MALGVPVDNQFQVNSFLPSSQTRPAVASGADDRVLVVWESNASSGTDDDGSSVQAQRYGPFVPEVFLDGFESADTTAWSDVEP